MGPDEDEVGDMEHNALLSDIRSLCNKGEKKKPTKMKRRKAAVFVGNVLSDLVSSIKSTKNVSSLKEDTELGGGHETKGSKAKAKKKSSKVSVPLHRQEQARVEAKSGSRTIKKQLRLWDPVVQENRAAEQLHFPLDDQRTFLANTALEQAKSFTPRTALEVKLAAALGRKQNLGADQLYTEEERELLKSLDLKQAKARTSQLQQLRAVMSSRAAKFARDAKIKSKKYHRVRKREKRRKLIKDIEDLMHSNPEAAREKLQELEKDRAFERALLKHRGGSKWSVQLKQYAARNTEMQGLIKEHLDLGRELKKRHGIAEEEVEGDSDTEEPRLAQGELLELAAEKAHREDDHSIAKASQSAGVRETLRRVRQELMATEVSLAPAEVLREDSQVLDDEFLADAFDGDDVVGEFEAAKEAEAERDKPADKDDRLFGWGDWTGYGISVEKQQKRKRKFLEKTAPKPRRDGLNSRLIIREEKNAQLDQLQPRDVPFPFSAVKDFEAVIRQPIGRDWNTNLAHRQLIKKSVVAQSGRVIRPIAREDLLARENSPEDDLDGILS